MTLSINKYVIYNLKELLKNGYLVVGLLGACVPAIIILPLCLEVDEEEDLDQDELVRQAISMIEAELKGKSFKCIIDVLALSSTLSSLIGPQLVALIWCAILK